MSHINTKLGCRFESDVVYSLTQQCGHCRRENTLQVKLVVVLGSVLSESILLNTALEYVAMNVHFQISVCIRA
jgi:hypothetical protein